MKNGLDVLLERGLVETASGERELRGFLQESRRVYLGIDPSADGLHLGNLVGLVVLAHLQRCGHTPVLLVGGATGLVGDPSGKSSERPLLNAEQVRKNCESIVRDARRILDFDHPTHAPLVVNNLDWFGDITLLDFLRRVGKEARMGPMLAKEMVRTRLDSEAGLSFTEFTYQLLQGYDFVHLLDSYEVTIQVGGSDQWGNITAGLELIRKLRQTAAYGLTHPLLVRADGKKFGKSESGAVWLNAEKMSPFAFYQYLFGVPDSDVIDLMKKLTFMELSEIAHWEKRMQQPGYVPNSAQKQLAEELTQLVHGEEGLKSALRATQGLVPGRLEGAALDATMLEAIAEDIPCKTFTQAQVLGSFLVDLLVAADLVPSKSEARRLIRNGGVYLNQEPIADERKQLKAPDLIEGRMLLLAVGKKRKMLVRTQA